jgi:hypothetical protein
MVRRGQKIGVRHEFLNTLVERDRAAAGNEAFGLALGTSAEGAEPAEVAVEISLGQNVFGRRN